MAQSGDKILVIDIEATCWDKSPPDGQEKEIIEIGICSYDVADDVVGGKHSILVRPYESEISEFCTELTSITTEQVEADGIDFAKACRVLVETYRARDYLWASWGGFDRKLFRRQCRRMGVSYPFGKKHLNIRGAFADCFNGRHPGMLAAMRLAGIEHIGRHHRGSDDAWNIARLLQALIHSRGKVLLERKS